VIETQELSDIPDLQAVVLQIFSLMISNEIFLGDRSRRSIVCIDEASFLLISPQMGGFIEGMARRLRKHNGALLVGTQSVLDFDTVAGAKAALQNSNWFIMLGCSGKELESLKKGGLLNVDPYTEKLLKSMTIREGQYSEAYITNSSSRFSAVVQLKLDPFSLGLFSTKPETVTAIQALEAEGLSLEDGIEKLAETKGVL
jgi:conjugal transfer ATP-binding protein TraC